MGPQVVSQSGPFGITRLELHREDRVVSRLNIVPFTLRIGAAAVRMDGIGGVGTEEEYRGQGCARQLLEAALERMRSGDAALSMLYGIPNFYPKFGYATAGPEHALHLFAPEEPPPLPEGWQARAFVKADLPRLQGLYETASRGSTGPTVRSATGRVWTRLVEAAGAEADECRILEDPARQVSAYAWRGRSFWSVPRLERDDPGALVLAEVVAADPAAADAVLDLCQQWAAEESAVRPARVRAIRLGLPPDSAVAAAAMRRGARFTQLYQPCGGSMARTLEVERLLTALLPELVARLGSARHDFQGSLRIETEIGAATLTLQGGAVEVVGSDLPPAPGASHVLRLPQAELARLALGAFPPDDLLDRLPEPPGLEVRELVQVLFPLRHPHMYLPDRY